MPPVRSPPLQHSSRRPATLAVAVTLLLAQAGGYLHELTATHGVCFEHGELVELDSPRAAEAAPAPDHLPTRLEGARPEEPGQDNHCAVALSRTHDGAPTPVLFQLAAPPLGLDAPALPAQPSSRQWAIYRLAPKSSPPA